MGETGICEIPSEMIRSALRETVEKKLESKNCKIKISSASKDGFSNFIGIVYRATFSKDDENEGGKHPAQKMIVKVSPQHLVRRELFISRPSFLREIYMYEKVLPYFRQFEQSKGLVLGEDGFIEYPMCYKTISDELHESLFLEDLSVRGFTMIDKSTEFVTVDHVRLMMQTLGKFHGISFAIKDQQPEKFNELASDLSELFVRQGDKLSRNYFNKMVQGINDALVDGEDAIIRTRLNKLFERETIDIAADCIDSKSAEPAAIITHGDTWQNNTMFKYDENGKPNEISLLDWQMSRYSSPIIDIVYYIFVCTTKELRDAHYDNFLRTYYDSLSTHIRRLGSNPEKLFPFDLMMEHFRKFGKIGLILATALLPIITANQEQGMNLDEISDQFGNYKNGTSEMPEFDDMPMVSTDSKNRYNKRIRDVAIDMERLGYI